MYHVYGRSLGEERIFDRESDRRDFLSRLQRGLEKPAIDCRTIAFALMPNHFHLIVQMGANEQAIRTLMIGVLSGFARVYNDRNDLGGALFERPYKARQINGATDLIGMVAYVHLNPPRALRDSRTSHLVYTGEEASTWIDAARGVRPFGGSREYAQYIASSEAIRVARRAARGLEE